MIKRSCGGTCSLRFTRAWVLGTCCAARYLEIDVSFYGGFKRHQVLEIKKVTSNPNPNPNPTQLSTFQNLAQPHPIQTVPYPYSYPPRPSPITTYTLLVPY